MTDMAKIFWSGRSQAVRLPKEYRLEGKEVHISRDGRKVILEPIEEDGWAWLERLEPLDRDAVATVLERPTPEGTDLLDDVVRLD
jgi:antitoxin VapB